MGGLQPWHLVIVVIVFMVLFGSKRLPDSARALGKSLRIFKAEMRAMGEDGPTDEGPSVPTTPPAIEAAVRQSSQATPVDQPHRLER